MFPVRFRASPQVTGGGAKWRSDVEDAVPREGGRAAYPLGNRLGEHRERRRRTHSRLRAFTVVESGVAGIVRAPARGALPMPRSMGEDHEDAHPSRSGARRPRPDRAVTGRRTTGGQRDHDGDRPRHGRPATRSRPRPRPRRRRASRRRHDERHRGQARRRADDRHGALRRRPPAHRGRARRRQDDARQGPRPLHRRDGPAHPVHARPAAQRRHRRQHLQPGRPALRVPARRRSSPTSSSATRSTAPRPRPSRRCSSRWRSGR